MSLLIVRKLNQEKTLNRAVAIAMICILFSVLFIGLIRDFLLKPILNLLVYNDTLTHEMCKHTLSLHVIYAAL